MAQYGEYNNTTVKSSACSYATLSHYNNGTQGMNRQSKSGATLTPTFNAPPGYNTVSARAVPTCSGYSNMQHAYSLNSGSCSQQFVSNLCQ
jgi:hypothetical protein